MLQREYTAKWEISFILWKKNIQNGMGGGGWFRKFIPTQIDYYYTGARVWKLDRERGTKIIWIDCNTKKVCCQYEEGWDDSYDEISEFKQHLHQEEVGLAHGKLKYGWIWYSNYTTQLQRKIIKLLKHMDSDPEVLLASDHYMMQFWGVVKEEGKHHHLSSSHLPFLVTQLSKGLCWYRKLSRNHVYVVNVQADSGDEEQLGGIGRVYRNKRPESSPDLRNKRPESSPDLRLYSAHEFPMRDKAAACGFRFYMALPLFDSNTNQSYGVLEILSPSSIIHTDILSALDGGLQIAELRSTHNFTTLRSTHNFTTEWELENEISEILELAMETVPQLYLAQVWAPCQQRVNNNINTNLCCMEFASFISFEDKKVDWWSGINDYDVLEYLGASEFHKLQIDIRSCHSNLCDLTISLNPLAHYAQRARMSHSFAVSLESINNNNSHLYVIQFFLEPNDRKDASYSSDYSRQLLLRIMAMNLKSFMFVDGSQKPNAIGCSLNVMESYEENFSESKFTTYLEIDSDSCCQRPDEDFKAWVFCAPGERSCKNHIKSNSLLIKEKVENFVKSLGYHTWREGYWIVQFWEAKMVDDRCYLQTLDQPCALSRLGEGLASFRKECMRHRYFVDDEPKLGPPGRVFRNRHREFTPHIFHYTTNEFSIRNYAMDCGSKGGYLALPIFDDEHNHKCVGVLEFLGYHYDELRYIKFRLEKAQLLWSYTDFRPRFLPNQQPENLDQTIHGREEALNEVIKALKLCKGIPQFHMANVWVPNGECVSCNYTNMSCMQLTLSTRYYNNFNPRDKVDWIHVQTGKEIFGMVLASENKSCFCHYEVSNRRENYFAICLQSSHAAGDLLYVVEFFLYPCPQTYEYIRSFLNFLLPIIQHELKSFKLACGKQLGQELVVEVIEYPEANKLDSSDSEHANVFPIKFKSVQYSQRSEEQHSEEHYVDASDSKTKQRGKRKIEEPSIIASDSNRKEKGKQKREVASDSKTRAKGERKNGLSLSYEVLKPHFGKKLQDVEKELGCKRSTIKRACRKYGIKRWPNKIEHIKNLFLFERGSGSESEQDTNTESTHPFIVENETEKVIIKVKYKEDTIKFELCLSLGVGKLFEEVAKKFNLKVGAFKLKYMDEDEDEILLTCDEDLQLCPKSQTATGKTCIHFYVQLISK